MNGSPKAKPAFMIFTPQAAAELQRRCAQQAPDDLAARRLGEVLSSQEPTIAHIPMAGRWIPVGGKN